MSLEALRNAAYERYWAAKTPSEESAAYGDFVALGGCPAYGSDAEIAAWERRHRGMDWYLSQLGDA